MGNSSIHNSSTGKGLRVAVDHKLYISQQCHLAVKRAKTTLR